MTKSVGSNKVETKEKRLDRGIFGNKSNPDARFIKDHQKLSEYVDACRKLNLSIALTSGTFDLLHVGHARYLEAAKSFGDILIVGVDSDEKVRARKGPERPVVSEDERVDMLSHLRSVDIVTLKNYKDPHWSLVKLIAPDILVVTKETYDKDTIKQLSEICGKVVILEPQATTSTSAQIRKLQIGWTGKIIEPVIKIMEEHGASPKLKKAVSEILTSHKNG